MPANSIIYSSSSSASSSSRKDQKGSRFYTVYNPSCYAVGQTYQQLFFFFYLFDDSSMRISSSHDAVDGVGIFKLCFFKLPNMQMMYSCEQNKIQKHHHHHDAYTTYRKRQQEAKKKNNKTTRFVVVFYHP